MKKITTVLAALLITAASFGQTQKQIDSVIESQKKLEESQKKLEPLIIKDTTVTLTCSLIEMRSLLFVIDQNIDSKKLSKELMEFIQKRVQIVADKPKELPPVKK